MSLRPRQRLRGLSRVQLGVVVVVVAAAGVSFVYWAKGLADLGHQAAANSSLSYADRDIAGGSAIIVDQQAAYQARALITPAERYRLVVGPLLKNATTLTAPFVARWFRYFLMPRRPAASARWIICYGCVRSQLGAAYAVHWSDANGISVGRLR